MAGNYDQEDAEPIRKMLERIAEKQELLDKHISELKTEFVNLKHTVIGDKQYSIKGIVDEIQEVKKYVENDKLLKNKIIGGLAVIGFIWTLLLKYVTHIFDTK